MTPLLTPQDRADLASYLQANAPDDILISAIERTKEYRENVRQDLASVRRYIGGATKAAPMIEPEAPKADEPEANDPPGTPVSRISTKSRLLIKNALRTPKLPNSLGQKYVGHFKLMWQRGEIQWNGKEYYL